MEFVAADRRRQAAKGETLKPVVADLARREVEEERRGERAVDDEAAIAAHRKAPHFATWRAAADVCVVKGSQVNTLCRQLFHHA